jgi:eukaryotic-like serine/threonine-protein kinase
MAKPKLVGPRLETPPPDASDRTSQRLPETLLSEQIQRLAVCAAIGAGLWTYGLVMDTSIRPLTLGWPVHVTSVVVEILAIVVSLTMFAYVRYSSHAHDRKTTAGLVYFVLNAAGVAVINMEVGLAAVSGGRGISWNTVVILVAAMILPATPRQMLVASLLSASMDPLAVWIAYLRGQYIASFANTLVLYMPNFACAVVAVLPARVLHRIGSRLRQAQELGSYQLVELLGRGGMGEVWRARHRLLARGAAIKLIRPELIGAGSPAETLNILRRFEHEAQATAALNSPHTIRVFDYGATADHTFYYVMELLEGRDLHSLVREFGPVPAGRVLFFLRQVCHSLAEAHARGVVHRDITPSNIYMCRMGLDYDFVKVLDFGLVKFHGARSSEYQANGKAHTTTGTPAFMAPEIVLGAEVDQRADVYALGCVMYYLLTGQPVFEASTTRELLALHLQTPPVPPSQRTEMPIPRELDALVLACLEKDPQRRPKDAAVVLEALLKCRCGDPWDNESAKGWWERHLVELSAPLAVTDALSLEPAFVVH